MPLPCRRFDESGRQMAGRGLTAYPSSRLSKPGTRSRAHANMVRGVFLLLGTSSQISTRLLSALSFCDARLPSVEE